MDEQDREFDPAVLLLLLPFARSLWNRYAPKSAKNKPTERYLSRALNGIKVELRALTERLRTGQTEQAEWLLDVQRYQDAIYIISSAVLAGTFELTATALEIGSEEWRRQAEFLAEFDRQIKDGEQPASGTLLTRIGLYAAAGWAIYQALRGLKAQVSEAVQEQRILGAADHCPDCIDEAAKGRQPLGTLRKIGDSVCRSNCHCHFIYFDAAGREVEV